jgi:hypothetical protein
MVDLRFVYFVLLITSLRDVFTMAKSELIYWGYNKEGKGAYNEVASDNASLIQFAFMYSYAIVVDIVLWHFGYYTIWKALGNIVFIAWLHWTGTEDFWFFVFSKWVKLPAEYIAKHPTWRISLFDFPRYLEWLSRPRKIGFITIPSIIGRFCGVKVPATNFVLFVLVNNLLVAAIAEIAERFI